MSVFEWGLVVTINAAIIGFGFWKTRGDQQSVDWFLAARSLPWWMVGLSMFATAVDSGDYVAVAGAAYQQGLPYISAWWIGLTVGWLLMTWVVLLPMYRGGMFTNCEYLEYRFGPVARVIAVLIQLQSRTNVLANVAFSLYLTFSILTGWDTNTWWLVVAIALAAAAYTATGGLKSVAITDSMQSVVMLIAAFVLWWSVWGHVGGWNGLQTRLSEHVESGVLEPEVARAMTHVGTTTETDVPPWLPVVGYVLVMSAYCVINQSQAMRMLAARSMWDLKMAAVVASGVTAIVMWFNVTLGVMGRALIPDLATGDMIFPELIKQFLIPMGGCLTGLVVAGLLAGGISTYDSVGSALASVFTRDIYARFIVRQAPDRHYLRVSRCATFVVIALSFVYIPFLKQGMVALYLKLVGVAVMPLLTIYVMGVLTTVARASGTPGLLVGIACGLTRFADPLIVSWFKFQLPSWWTNTWWGYLWSCGITALTMLLVSIVRGWSPRAEREQFVLGSDQAADSEDWLVVSRRMVPQMEANDSVAAGASRPLWTSPILWTLLLVSIVCALNLVIYW
ncbi:MAG: sodium/solute symporter [Planctomycetaceae bacterium]